MGKDISRLPRHITNLLRSSKQAHSLSVWMLSSMWFFLSKAREQKRFLKQYVWEGDISKLAGGHQNKLFDVFKPSPFPANLDFELHVVPPYPADNHKRFLTNLFGREIFQSFIEVITTNRFEASNQVHPLCVRIMSSMVFQCKSR